MPLFRNSDSSGGERSDADRERARLEREARRRGVSVDDVLRERGELPSEPEPVEPEPIEHDEPEPEPQLEPDPEPVEPAPEPVEDGIEWTQPPAPEPEPASEPEPEPSAVVEPEPEPEPDPEPHGSMWDQPPAPGPTGDLPAPVGDDLPPKELDPPALPARSSARPLPRPPRRRYAQADARRSPAQGPVKRKRSWAARIAAIVVLIVVVGILWFLFNLFQPGKGDGDGSVSVTIPQGATAREIGDLLADEGVVSSGFYFDLRTRLAGNRDEFKAGAYKLRHDMSYGAAMDALTATKTQPQAPTVKVTIPEGRSRTEIAAALKKDGIGGNYMTASTKHKGFDPTQYDAPKNTKSLEGFLFPATYDLPEKGASANTLVGDQLDAFKDNFSQVSLRDAKKKNLTPYDVLIIASMIEREAQVAKDRPLISAVIYNRLHDGMPLGIDATTRYELNNWTRPLRVSELQKDTPYNTRTRRGLPPTPIGNPGLASIKAAAHPAKVDYLFYVAKPGTCGEHAFSATDAQFQKDVAAYDAARAKNGGKSPDTC